jgi:hypothetical protein
MLPGIVSPIRPLPFEGKFQTIKVRLARMGIVFFCVSFLWIFFKLPNFGHALSYISGKCAMSFSVLIGAARLATAWFGNGLPLPSTTRAALFEPTNTKCCVAR